jgi:single-strand DNA-binding protein
MPNANHCRLIGYIGKDPELQYAPLEAGPTPVLKLRLAETFKYANGSKEKTTWHTIVFWRDQAEYAAKHYKKGDNIEAEGRYDSREFTPKDGSKRTVYELTVYRSYKLHRNPKEQAPALDDTQAATEEDGVPKEEATVHAGSNHDAWPS